MPNNISTSTINFILLKLFFLNQKPYFGYKYKISSKYKTIINFLQPNIDIVTYSNIFKSLFGSLLNNTENEKNKLDNPLIILINEKKIFIIYLSI